MAVVELIEPRIVSVPPCASSVGVEAVEFARRIGMTLDLEQEMVLERSLGVGDDGRWAAFEVGFNAPRQNGKGEVLLARELFGLFELGEGLIVHSAHEFKTSSRHFTRMEAVIRACPELMARVGRRPDKARRLTGFHYTHGAESVELDDGSRLEFRTRTKSSLRGFDDVGLLVLDEAMIFSEWAHGTMLPTVRASKAERGPQLWYAGNAADRERDDHAVVWTRIRERGLSGDDPSLAYFEWSLDFEHPDDVPDEVLEDEDEWMKVNWAIGRGRVPIEMMRNEKRTMLPRAFCSELLGVSDYPDTELVGNSEIDMQLWADCEDEESVLQDPVCISFDVAPDRRATIAAAGLNGGRKFQVEVIASRAGTAWVPERLADLCEKHEIVEIVCDGFGPANAIANKVEEQTGLSVRRLKTGEYADSCGQFANAVEENEMVHIGQEDLTTSVRGARTRPLVDRWAWSRSKAKTDPGPVIACSIALWSAVDRDIANREELVIF